MILNFGLARFSICGKAPKESDRRQKCAETARAAKIPLAAKWEKYSKR